MSEGLSCVCSFREASTGPSVPLCMSAPTPPSGCPYWACALKPSSLVSAPSAKTSVFTSGDPAMCMKMSGRAQRLQMMAQANQEQEQATVARAQEDQRQGRLDTGTAAINKLFD